MQVPPALVSQFPVQELCAPQVDAMVITADRSPDVGLSISTKPVASDELKLQTDPSHSQFASAEQAAEEEINEHSAAIFVASHILIEPPASTFSGCIAKPASAIVIKTFFITFCRGSLVRLREILLVNFQLPKQSHRFGCRTHAMRKKKCEQPYT